MDCGAGKNGGALSSSNAYDLGLRVARVPIAAKSSPFVSLFNGKDTAGWTKTHEDKAEVVKEDGQPILRLSEPVVLSRPIVGDYHLRCDYKIVSGEHGGGLQLFGPSNGRFELRLANLKDPHAFGVSYSCQPAEIRAGRILGVGKSLGDNARFNLTKDSINTTTPWQRIEVLRLGDSFAFLINGKLSGAVTNVRNLRDGQKEIPRPRAYFRLWAFGGPAQFCNSEVREINSLPPEIAP